MNKTHLLTLLLMVGSITAEASPFPNKLSAEGLRDLCNNLNDHCLLIDGSLSDAEAAQNPFVFNTFQEAMQHLQPGTADNRMTVLIRPGVYWIDDPDDPEIRRAKNGDHAPIGMHVRCPWLHLVGLGEQSDDVILASARGQTQGAVGNFTMFFFHGDGLLLENLTLGNYCNVDLVYRLDPSKNRPRRMEAICQAQLAFADGDYLEARNCRFISRLNTCPLNGGRRTLFDHCYFESTDDALEGRAIYRHCRFTFYSNKPFYATSRAGAILYDCDFDCLSNDTQYLCKQESPVILLNSRFHTPATTTVGWCPYISPQLRCYQWKVSQNGKPIRLSSESPQTGVILDIRESPETQDHPIIPELKDLPKYLDLPIDSLFAVLETLPIHQELIASKSRVEEGDTTTTILRTYAFGNRLLSEKPSVSFIGNNQNDTTRTEVLIVGKTNGLQAAVAIENAPKTLPAPIFTKRLKIKRQENTLRAIYQLDLGNRADQSLITWYRCDGPTGEGAIPVSVSRLNHPEQTYNLQPADYGRYIMTEVKPKHLRSFEGEARRFIIHIKAPKTRKSTASTESQIYETDFQNFPTNPQPLIRDGYWTVDGFKPQDTAAQNWQPRSDSWVYGEGIDGAKGTGLLQKEKGARLLYTPILGARGKVQETSITLTCDPCKTAAQGFASATDQYMDIYIHYDTQNRTGFGLRIIRTTKHANAVDMQLMKFEKGGGELLGEPVSTTCFLTNCTIRLWSENGLLKAHASTTTPQRESNLAKEVNLSAPIQPEFNGIGIQHTGSAGASATMFHHLKVEWK